MNASVAIQVLPQQVEQKKMLECVDAVIVRGSLSENHCLPSFNPRGYLCFVLKQAFRRSFSRFRNP
jgi:hypothetical protein